MKTQFIVTVTQTGENPVAPSELVKTVRGVVRHVETENTKVTVRHTMEDTEPAADTLEALVREYGNTPTTGKGRVRSDVLADIRALMPAEKPTAPVDVSAAVNALNAVAEGEQDTVTLSRKVLQGVIRDGHRAGQQAGRLLGKESHERAADYARGVVVAQLQLTQ